MVIRLLQAAEIELDDGYIYYEDQVKGLGHEFINEVLYSFKIIRSNPTAWSPFSKRTRRYLIHRFPFGIIYQIREKELLIIAIAHLHRKPGYWNNRIES